MRVWCGQSPTAMRFLGNSLSRLLGRISCAVYLSHSLVLASLARPSTSRGSAGWDTSRRSRWPRSVSSPPRSGRSHLAVAENAQRVSATCKA
jgi:hypothetical protein